MYNGIVCLSLQSSSKDFEKQFIETITKLVKENPTLIEKDIEKHSGTCSISNQNTLSINILPSFPIKKTKNKQINKPVLVQE